MTSDEAFAAVACDKRTATEAALHASRRAQAGLSHYEGQVLHPGEQEAALEEAFAAAEAEEAAFRIVVVDARILKHRLETIRGLVLAATVEFLSHEKRTSHDPGSSSTAVSPCWSLEGLEA